MIVRRTFVTPLRSLSRNGRFIIWTRIALHLPRIYFHSIIIPHETRLTYEINRLLLNWWKTQIMIKIIVSYGRPNAKKVMKNRKERRTATTQKDWQESQKVFKYVHLSLIIFQFPDCLQYKLWNVWKLSDKPRWSPSCTFQANPSSTSCAKIWNTNQGWRKEALTALQGMRSIRKRLAAESVIQLECSTEIRFCECTCRLQSCRTTGSQT